MANYLVKYNVNERDYRERAFNTEEARDFMGICTDLMASLWKRVRG